MGRSGLVLLVALVLSPGILLVFPSSVPLARADPYHLEAWSNSTSGGTDTFHSTNWLAQSFTTPGNFRITRVAVFVRDVGSDDVLRLSIRPNAGVWPAGTNLTTGTNNSDSADPADWVYVDLSPWVDLSGGAIYWLVLMSTATSGYEWSHSSGDVYTGGRGVESTTFGLTWSNRSRDYAFRVYGFEQSNLAFAASASNGAPRPGETLVLRADVTNSGNGDAAVLWVNVTLPPQLTYVSDDAAAWGGTRTGTYRYTFTNVSPGPHSFNITTSVNFGVPHGTIATTNYVFDSTDHNGVSQPTTTRNVSLTIQNSLLTFAASVSSGNPRPGDQPEFRADITNFGGAAAAFVWVNVTLPTLLSYVSDDAAASGGTRTGDYNFTFTGVAPGPLAFNLTAYVNGGIPDGTVATTSFVFDSTDYNGLPQPRTSRVVPIVVRNAALFLSHTASIPLADPGDLVTYNATARNVGQETAANAALEGVLDPVVFFVSHSSGASYDPGTRTVRRTGLTIPAGTQASLEWTVRIRSDATDGTSVNSTSVATYRDITGATMSPETAAASVTVRVPVFATSLTADPGEAEKGDIVFVTLTYDNTGSASAVRAWANWTTGSNFALLSLTPTYPYVTTSDGFDVSLADVAEGPHAMIARLRVLRGLNDNLPLPIEVRWLGTDGNGNPLSGATLTTRVVLRAPKFTIGASAPVPRQEVDKDFVVIVTLRNEGGASGTGWLNLTLPQDVTYVSDNGTFPVSASWATLTWRIPAVPQGSRIDLAVTLRGKESGTGTLRFTLDYTDDAASAPTSVLSNAVSVEFGTGTPWALWLLAVLPAPVLLAFYLLRRKATIEEVFLVSVGGLLLAHMSYTIKHSRDRDVMSAMLTAIQDFIRDAFTNSPQGAVRSIDFGQQKILIRRGTSSYLAVVLKGAAGRGLLRRLEETLRKVETAFPQGADYVDEKMAESATELLAKELLRR